MVKAASQAGHAFLDSFLSASPEITKAYLDDGGTKIVLAVPDEASLWKVYRQAVAAKLPCAMVIEEHHIMPPSFDGSKIPTAVGIGPVLREHAKPITGELPLMK